MENLRELTPAVADGCWEFDSDDLTLFPDTLRLVGAAPYDARMGDVPVAGRLFGSIEGCGGGGCIEPFDPTDETEVFEPRRAILLLLLATGEAYRDDCVVVPAIGEEYLLVVVVV